MTSYQEEHYELEYRKWVAGMSKEELQKAKALGVDRPLKEEAPKGIALLDSTSDLTLVCRVAKQEPDARKICVSTDAQDRASMEIVSERTPRDCAMENEDNEGNQVREAELRAAKASAIHGFLAVVFAAKAGRTPSPFDVLETLYALVKKHRPELIDNWSLEKIGAIFGKSKQAISKAQLRLQDNGFRSRDQKGKYTISRYKENTRAWWAEKKANERKEARRAYLKAYGQAHRDEITAQKRAYYAANRARLLEARKANRAKKRAAKAGL